MTGRATFVHSLTVIIAAPKIRHAGVLRSFLAAIDRSRSKRRSSLELRPCRSKGTRWHMMGAVAGHVVLGQRRRSVSSRLADGVCRRAFSSPEAWLYEFAIAAALSRIVVPVLEPRLVGTLVLDVGAGGGRTALALSGGRTVVGVDPSRAQVARLAKRAPGRPSAVRATAERLPFADETFDSVYSSCVFKHWADPSLGVAECLRVVRRRGSVVTIEIDGASTPAELRTFADQSRVPVGLRSAYARFAMRTVVGVAPTLDELRQAFDGLDVVAVEVDRTPGMPFLVAVVQRRG